MSESGQAGALGVSGRIARQFLTTEITPLLALVGVLVGLFAVLVTPREEEPQIDVTFANVFIPFPGATAKEVETLVSSRAEQILSEIEGVAGSERGCGRVCLSDAGRLGRVARDLTEARRQGVGESWIIDMQGQTNQLAVGARLEARDCRRWREGGWPWLN